jgi:hypothetical protein
MKNYQKLFVIYQAIVLLDIILLTLPNQSLINS